MKQLFMTLATLAMLLSACGSDDGAGGDGVGEQISFGADDGKCASVKLRNELDDPEVLEVATSCFFSEVNAGNSVVIDIIHPTVEGDGIYLRYQFDGESFLLVQDSRLDAFGQGVVDAQRCDRIEATAFLPDGVGCVPVDHRGFVEAS